MTHETPLNRILKLEECELARTPEELLLWIESIHEKLAASDQTRKLARQGVGLTKPFFEEIVPLGQIARHKYLGTAGVYLQPRIGNQNFDAEIVDNTSSKGVVKRIEFTHLYYDHDLALRLEYLSEHGSVPLTGPIMRKGSKATGGKISADLEVVDRGDRVPALIKRAEERISAKLRKSYSKETVLAAVFDDYLLDESQIYEFGSYCSERLRPNVLDYFSAFFVIGAKDTFWEFPVPTQQG